MALRRVLNSNFHFSKIYLRTKPGIVSKNYSSTIDKNDDEFDAHYLAYLSKPDIDGWECRKAMNDLCGYDMVPEPKIVIEAMKACRRLNDYALAVRYLEAIHFKGRHDKAIWPYMLKEIGPTLKELGILSPEEMGYDKPELALKNVFDM